MSQKLKGEEDAKVRSEERGKFGGVGEGVERWPLWGRGCKVMVRGKGWEWADENGTRYLTLVVGGDGTEGHVRGGGGRQCKA